MILLCGIADSIEDARRMTDEKLASGDALERFRRNIGCQGGDQTICDDPEKLFDASVVQVQIKADRSGFVSTIDTLAIGNALVDLGGGRRLAGDGIDHAIGYECIAPLGREVREGDTVGVLFCRSEAAATRPAQKITLAYSVAAEPPDLRNLICDVIPTA
jgi:thymidine phosphorylase